MTVIAAVLAILTLFAYSYFARNSFELGLNGEGKTPSARETENQGNEADENKAEQDPKPPGNNENQVNPEEQQNEAAQGEESVRQDTVTITLKGKDQICWINIRVDGNSTFTGNLNPGETKTFSGSKVLMTLGNAGAVEVVRDGNSIGVLGGYGDVIKNREFTAETP